MPSLFQRGHFYFGGKLVMKREFALAIEVEILSAFRGKIGTESATFFPDFSSGRKGTPKY